MTTLEEIEHHYNCAIDLAIKHVKFLAKKHLNENPNLHEFIMNMGCYHFTDKNGDIEYDCRCDELDSFMGDWDDDLHISGEAMRFTAKGEIVTHW